MAKKIKIKKCPCCHNEAVLYRWPYVVGFGDSWDIHCSNPNCTIQTEGYFSSPKEAIDVWNTRRRFFRKKIKPQSIYEKDN